jgi:hypothetical protein
MVRSHSFKREVLHEEIHEDCKLPGVDRRHFRRHTVIAAYSTVQENAWYTRKGNFLTALIAALNIGTLMLR